MLHRGSGFQSSQQWSKKGEPLANNSRASACDLLTAAGNFALRAGHKVGRHIIGRVLHHCDRVRDPDAIVDDAANSDLLSRQPELYYIGLSLLGISDGWNRQRRSCCFTIEYVGIKVNAVGPDQCMHLWVNRNLSEE